MNDGMAQARFWRRAHHYSQQGRHFARKLHLFAAKGAGYHAIYGRWQAKRVFYQWRGLTNQGTAAPLWAKLDRTRPSLNAVWQAVQAQDEAGARRELARYFRQRPAPQFCFEADTVPMLVKLVTEQAGAAQAQTIRLAEEIVHNRFTFRGAPTVTFGARIDWQQQPGGNVDWRWDLNRHTFFETLGRAYWYTGDPRYVDKGSHLLHDWLAQNPPAVNAPNWASVFEVALRINTWLWAFYLLRQADAFTNESLLALVQGLWQHGYFLERFLEHHAQNNHLLLEAKALAMVGLLFPECEAGARWLTQGLALFYREFQAQVCSDGVHGERATLYHRIITGETLELLVLLERNQIKVPDEITAKFAKMVAFEQAVTKPDDTSVLLGDSALTDVHLRFAGATGGAAFLACATLCRQAPQLGEAELWLLEATGPSTTSVSPSEGSRLKPAATFVPPLAWQRSSQAFPEGGYFVMQAGAGAATPYLLVDCGPFGYQKDATHGHADALSFELYAHGQSWLVDPGVYSTHLGWAWRRFFRGTAAHNTVVVDEQDQSLLLDSRRVYRPAQATLHQWYSGESFDFFDGAHDGYQRLAAPVTHRRQIFFAKPEYWVVIDRLTGVGGHTFDCYFHLMAGLAPQLDPQTGQLWAENAQGAALQILPLTDGALTTAVMTGTTEPIQGWVSQYSGEKSAAPTLRYRRQAVAPVTFCTVLYPHPAGHRRTAVQVAALPVVSATTGEPYPAVMALTIDTGGYIDYLLVAGGAAGRSDAATEKQVAGFTIAAPLFYLRRRKSDGAAVNAVIGGPVPCRQAPPHQDWPVRLAPDFRCEQVGLEGWA